MSRGLSEEGSHGKFPIAKALQRCGVSRRNKSHLTAGTVLVAFALESVPDRPGIKCPSDIQGCLWNKQLFLAGRWCQAFSFLPGIVPQKKTPMPAFWPTETYCTMRQQSFQARFSIGLRDVRSGSQMGVEKSMFREQAKGSAWVLLC